MKKSSVHLAEATASVHRPGDNLGMSGVSQRTSCAHPVGNGGHPQVVPRSVHRGAYRPPRDSNLLHVRSSQVADVEVVMQVPLYQAKADFFARSATRPDPGSSGALDKRDHAVHELLAAIEIERATCPQASQCSTAPASSCSAAVKSRSSILRQRARGPRPPAGGARHPALRSRARTSSRRTSAQPGHAGDRLAGDRCSRSPPGGWGCSAVPARCCPAAARVPLECVATLVATSSPESRSPSSRCRSR